MFRALGLAGALALAIGLSTPAHAQQMVTGGYCGDVTWQGGQPEAVWVAFRRNNTWATAEDGAMSAMGQGSFSQTGNTLNMTGGQSPQYQVVAIATGDRVEGTVVASDGRRGVISMTMMRSTGTAQRNTPVPPNFVPTSAERAIAGDMQGLLEAISWGWTPQGVEYWRPIYQAGRLPDHAAETLRDWIRRSNAGERPVCDAQ